MKILKLKDILLKKYYDSFPIYPEEVKTHDNHYLKDLPLRELKKEYFCIISWSNDCHYCFCNKKELKDLIEDMETRDTEDSFSTYIYSTKTLKKLPIYKETIYTIGNLSWSSKGKKIKYLW